MDTSFTITIYIDNKPHRLHVSIKTEANITRYKIEQDGVNKIKILPSQFVINADGERLEAQNDSITVEQQQLVRLICQNIYNVISV